MNESIVAGWFKTLQDEICTLLENVDGKAKFLNDIWEREGGGGGVTRVIQNGNIIEKGGVNFSAVHGKLAKSSLEALKINADAVIPNDQFDFFATGVSVVLHSSHPRIPIIHMNVRYFKLSAGNLKINDKQQWFGGGIDLSPVYIDEDDARFFHRQLKNVCDAHDSSYYPEFKKWADEYFFIKHRNETRGVGGIFFDRLTSTKKNSLEDRFNFVKNVGKNFVPIYAVLAEKNRERPFTEKHKEFQYFRRGRYAEFNLVYDRGTKFGLETDGRAESILMSLPPLAKWKYNYLPLQGSEEANTINLLRKGIDWLQPHSESV